MANALFISYDGMTDPLGQSQVIPYLSALSDLGHTITIVSAEKTVAFKKSGDQIKSLLSEKKISWNPVLFSNKIPGWSAWRNYKRLLHKASEVCDGSKIEILHCRSYIPALIGLKLKKKFNSKMIFDMRGFWADERVEGGLWNLSNPVYRFTYNFFKRKEKQLLIESDAIVSLTSAAKEEMLSWKDLKLPSEKITVIPCCADFDFFSQQNIDIDKQAEMKRQLSIQQTDFILSYSGSLGTWYLLDEMLQFFSCLLVKKPETKFLFITPEPKSKILESAQRQKIPLEKIIIVAGLRNKMPLLLSLSQASVFFIKNSFSKKASSPTKMGELMSMEIPVICNAGVGDVEEIVQKTGAGIAVKNFSQHEFEKAASRIDELLSIPKEKIRKGAEQFFSLSHGAEEYQRIYSSLL